MKHLSAKNRDYSFLYDYSLLRPGTVKRIEKMVRDFRSDERDVEIDLPFRFRFKFTSAERALDYLLQVQLFYRLVCSGIESSVWMQAHHCQPRQLKGLDVAENLVTVPLPVHWYLHFLHGIIGEMTGNRRLERHSANSCLVMRFEPDSLIRCGFDPVEVDRVRRAHMASRIYWSDERLRKEAVKYTSKKTFKRGCGSAYQAALKRFPGLIDELFANQRQSWNEASLRAEAAKYGSKKAFSRGCESAYRAAQRMGIIDELFTNQRQSWNEDSIRRAARRYATASTMAQCTTHGGSKAYHAARRLGIVQTLRFQPLTVFNRDIKRRAAKQRHKSKPKPQIINLFHQTRK